MSLSINLSVSVVVPTYGRNEVLVETIRYLLNQSYPASEILIIDQTPRHIPETEKSLKQWHDSGVIRWITRTPPSITGAMNQGIVDAKSSIILFVDDDIVPNPDLIAEHVASYSETNIWAVTGQVLQPGEVPDDVVYTGPQAGLYAYLAFPFNSVKPTIVKNVMAGNLSVRKKRALQIGGFDENFIGVAYRFETEFARRLVRAGGKIRFQPNARINHLRDERGGTRSGGSHLNSASPIHGVGDYYFAMTGGIDWETVRYVLRRPVREVCTRFHLRRPWWIPVKLFGELRAFIMGIRLSVGPPRLLKM